MAVVVSVATSGVVGMLFMFFMSAAARVAARSMWIVFMVSLGFSIWPLGIVLEKV